MELGGSTATCLTKQLGRCRTCHHWAWTTCRAQPQPEYLGLSGWRLRQLDCPGPGQAGGFRVGAAYLSHGRRGPSLSDSEAQDEPLPVVHGKSLGVTVDSMPAVQQVASHCQFCPSAVSVSSPLLLVVLGPSGQLPLLVTSVTLASLK